MTKEVTPRQREIFEAAKRVLSRGERPTYRAIAQEAGCNLSYAFVAIQSLAKKGLIKRKPGKHAGISVVDGA